MKINSRRLKQIIKEEVDQLYQEETEIDTATIQKNYEEQVVSKLDDQGKMALKLYVDALKAGTIKGDE